MRLLVTRPEEDAAPLAQALRQRGHDPIVSPLLEIKLLPVAAVNIGEQSAVIATSRNALRALALDKLALSKARAVPLYVTGSGTGELADTLGFTDIRPGPGTASALPPFIQRTLAPRGAMLLYLAGESVAFDLVTALITLGYRVNAVTSYTAVPVRSLRPEALTALRDGTLDGVILMSPRTAGIFAEIAAQLNPAENAGGLYCYCLSQNVAAKLDGLPGAMRGGHVRIAERPDLPGILAAIDNNNGAV